MANLPLRVSTLARPFTPIDARAEEGFELFCDLCLADCLATGGTASRVVIQLKGHPTFVSDAMAKDMMAMIDLLADLDEAEYPRCVPVRRK